MLLNLPGGEGGPDAEFSEGLCVDRIGASCFSFVVFD